MRRAGALLVAVAMVVAAFVVRDRVADDETDVAAGDGEVADLLCPVELEDVCRRVSDDIVVEVAGETADRLLAADAADDLGAEAWIVPAAWARLVVDERSRLGAEILFEVGPALAATPVVRVVWTDVSERLGAQCDGEVDWGCVAEQVGARTVRAGGPPVDSATGLTVAAAQAADLLDRTDYATNDFDPEFRTHAAALAAGQTDDALTTMRTRGPGALAAAGVVEAEITDLTSSFGTLDVTAEPVRTDLVALVPVGRDPDVVSGLGPAFVDAGWDAPTDAPDGLPEDGSVLAAVRTLWKDNQP